MSLDGTQIDESGWTIQDKAKQSDKSKAKISK